MSFSNVKLILSREIRDQLRDRRTLFMMFVLPLLLYPLLGMSYFQISQFTQEKPTRVLVVGTVDEDDLPPLFEDGGFSPKLFSDPVKARLSELHFVPAQPSGTSAASTKATDAARLAVQSGEYDAALVFPDDFGREIEEYRRVFQEWTPGGPRAERADLPELPRPRIIYTTANETSQIALLRLTAVLDRWHEEVRQSVWADSGLPPAASKPPEVDADDLADQTSYHGAAMWSKLLPVMLLIWALTGAFYPAIDLCAGEKERGTLETLLSSPAERSEIVLGKLLTIMLFSATTAVLNLVSVGVTGWLVLGRYPEFGPPPPMAVVWLAIALVPVSAMFSALCLALAAFARSSKEGQYYLMPLLLVTMPLAVLPMTPGVELTLGNALIPVTGVVLLLRSLLEGNWEALQMLPVVLAVTLAACLLAIRWAVDQFNSESVLFRESERFDLGLWVHHLIRDRQPTPSPATAVFCGVTILVIHFMLSATATPSNDRAGFIQAMLMSQVASVALPALLMAYLLTGSPRQTLLLKRPSPFALATVLMLVLAVHPVVHAIRAAVMRLYPMSEAMKQGLAGLFPEDMAFGQLLLLVAVLPAICEELAFRGFILSGLRHLGHRWRAVIYTALLFGLVHGIVQQQVVAFLVGVVIGYVAVQTGSIFPCMLFHLMHNSLLLAASQVTAKDLANWPWLRGLVGADREVGLVFHWPVVAAAGVATLLLLWLLSRLPCQKSAEEQLQEAIDHGGSTPDSEPLAARG